MPDRWFPGPDAQLALNVMEWAYESTEAIEAAPEETERYRAFFDHPWNPLEESCWRTLLDQALIIWQKGYDLYRKKQEAF